MKPLQKQGFTLIEIMVVVAIMAIFAGIAIPDFIGWLPRHRLSQAAQDVSSGIIKARSRAVKDNTVVVFGPNAANNGFWAFADDGAGSADTDLNSVPDDAFDSVQNGSEQTVVTVPMPSGIAITASFQTVFDRRGFPSAGGTITLRNSRSATRDIDLLLTGNVQVGEQN